MANNQKMLLASIDATASFNKQGNDNSNDAAARNKGGSSFLQRVCGILIIGVAFLGLLVVGPPVRRLGLAERRENLVHL